MTLRRTHTVRERLLQLLNGPLIEGAAEARAVAAVLDVLDRIDRQEAAEAARREEPR